jgi:hypothetical protein
VRNANPPDADCNTAGMAEKLQTQHIGDVYTGPGGQTFVGRAGRDVIFANTVDPNGELHTATLLWEYADLVMP